jgi:acyl-CoA synthetase (NDP forming)
VLNTDPAIVLNATLAPVNVERGSIGFFCQSGALGSMTLQAVLRRGIGLSTFVSAGNRADVSGNDLLQFWAGDPATDVILLWLESFGNPRKFSRLARRVARHKPVVMLGRGPWSDIDTAGLQRLFADVGVIWVDTLDELFDVGMLLGYQPLPAGPSVAVVGNSTAVGVLAADACAGAGLTVAEGYPVHLEPDADPQTLARAVALALADPGVDSAVVVFVPPLPSAGVDHAEAIATVTADHGKPVVSTFLGLEGFPAGLARRGSDGVMGRGSIPSYPSPERAVHALAKSARYAQWRARPVGHVPELVRIDRAAAERLVAEVLPERRALTDAEAARLLAAYGSDVRPRRLVSTPDDAVRAAEELGYPVAVTAMRGRGTASLDLADADEVRSAWTQLARDFVEDTRNRTTAARGSPAAADRAASSSTAGRAAPFTTPTERAAQAGPIAAGRVAAAGAAPRIAAPPAEAGPIVAAPGAVPANVASPTVAGSPIGVEVAVQSMAPPGVWTTLAVADDPTCNSLVTPPTPKDTSELLGDRAYASVPMTDVDAARLVRAPRAAALLSGYRGAAPVELGALEELVLRLARLADDLPEVLAVELDPVLVGERSLSVLAAAVTVGTATARANPGPRRLRSVQTNQPTGSTTA